MLLLPGGELRWTAVVAPTHSYLSHQDFGKEHVANFIWPELGWEHVGVGGSGGKVCAMTVGNSVNPGHSRVKVAGADLLWGVFGGPMEEMSL